MTVVYKCAEALRCSHCALVGIASLSGDLEKTETKIDRLPEGFKIVSTEGAKKVYCSACNQPATALSLGSQ
jgi:hypothetical protein